MPLEAAKKEAARALLGRTYALIAFNGQRFHRGHDGLVERQLPRVEFQGSVGRGFGTIAVDEIRQSFACREFRGGCNLEMEMRFAECTSRASPEEDEPSLTCFQSMARRREFKACPARMTTPRR